MAAFEQRARRETQAVARIDDRAGSARSESLSIDGLPLRDLLSFISGETWLDASSRGALDRVGAATATISRTNGATLPAAEHRNRWDALHRALNALRHAVNVQIGSPFADWDIEPEALMADMDSDRSTGCRFPGMNVYAEDIRSPYNIGAIMRTCEAFGVGELVLSAGCADPSQTRARRTAMGAGQLLPVRTGSEYSASGNDPVFALELGGTPIQKFHFPDRGVAIVGSEELGISPHARAAALRSAGIVSIPLYGGKGSLNVSAATAVLLAYWSDSLSSGAAWSVTSSEPRRGGSPPSEP